MQEAFAIRLSHQTIGRVRHPLSSRTNQDPPAFLTAERPTACSAITYKHRFRCPSIPFISFSTALHGGPLSTQKLFLYFSFYPTLCPRLAAASVPLVSATELGQLGECSSWFLTALCRCANSHPRGSFCEASRAPGRAQNAQWSSEPLSLLEPIMTRPSDTPLATAVTSRGRSSIRTYLWHWLGA